VPYTWIPVSARDDTGGYVSAACRVGEHDECARRPVVRCACGCHAEDEAGTSGQGTNAP